MFQNWPSKNMVSSENWVLEVCVNFVVAYGPLQQNFQIMDTQYIGQYVYYPYYRRCKISVLCLESQCVQCSCYEIVRVILRSFHILPSISASTPWILTQENHHRKRTAIQKWLIEDEVVDGR